MLVAAIGVRIEFGHTGIAAGHGVANSFALMDACALCSAWKLKSKARFGSRPLLSIALVAPEVPSENQMQVGVMHPYMIVRNAMRVVHVNHTAQLSCV